MKSIKQKIEALSVPGAFKFEVETLNRMEHIVVMVIENFAKYLEWTTAE